MGRLVILSGPSCVGKGPLCAALAKFYPELAARLRKVVLHTSRAPRPAEVDGVDYHFRTRQQVEALRGKSDHLVLEIRGDLQAIDLREIDRLLAEGDAFLDANPIMAGELRGRPLAPGAGRLSVYLSPLSREEILYLKAPERNISLADFVAKLMRAKLLRRTTRQRGLLSLAELEDIERRATRACAEMKEARRYDHVLPNHDGEDSENWSAFYYPIGDARRTLLAFADLLEGRVPPVAEKWEEGLIPWPGFAASGQGL